MANHPSSSKHKSDQVAQHRLNPGKKTGKQNGRSWRQLELSFSFEVEDGLAEPDEANLPELTLRFDQMLAALPEGELLNYGGLYLDKLSALYHARAMALLDDWEEEYNHEGPHFDDDLLLGLVKEHQTVDVSGFVKPARRVRAPKPTGPIDEDDSVFVELDTEQAVLLAQQDLEDKARSTDLSHSEDVSGWIQAVAEHLKQRQQPVRLLDLYQQVPLSWIELLLALLLGGFELEQTGSFYQADSLWVMPFGDMATGSCNIPTVAKYNGQDERPKQHNFDSM